MTDLTALSLSELRREHERTRERIRIQYAPLRPLQEKLRHLTTEIVARETEMLHDRN